MSLKGVVFLGIKLGLVAFLVHQPWLFHCPAFAEGCQALASIPPAEPEIESLISIIGMQFRRQSERCRACPYARF